LICYFHWKRRERAAAERRLRLRELRRKSGNWIIIVCSFRNSRVSVSDDWPGNNSRRSCGVSTDNRRRSRADKYRSRRKSFGRDIRLVGRNARYIRMYIFLLWTREVDLSD